MEMNEKKLTDEEIIKILGLVANDKEKDGFTLLAKNALDLIYRLQDEKQKVIQDYYAESQHCDQQKDIIAKQKSEIERLKDEKKEIKLFNLAIQNGEVDMRIESEMAKSFYNSIVQVFEQNGAKNFFTTTIDIEGKKGRYAFTIEKVGGQTVAEKLAEQKAEIERLTEREKFLENAWHISLENANTLDIALNASRAREQEYKKQVDELKEERENMQAEIIGLESQKEDLYFQNQNLQSYIDNHEPIWKRNTEQAVKDTAKEIYDFAKDFFEWDEEGFVRELKEFVQGYDVEVE